jgi:peptide chain release factor 2
MTKLVEEQLIKIEKRLLPLLKKLNLEEKKTKIEKIKTEMESPDFWLEREKAQKKTQELAQLEEIVNSIQSLEKSWADLKTMAELGMEEDLAEEIKKIEKELDKMEVETFLAGPYDQSEAILSIHAGQGGTEAMDWAEMLLRMYWRYAERHGWQPEIVDQTPGEEAGIKNATLLVSGLMAYGYLKGEAGTHRLVRQSPFNADHLRQTSFALVEVLPKLEETPGIEIKDEDLEWQFFRASTQGGQNVQKVSTAVRLVHKPTGMMVTSQSQRYQEQNRKIALQLLQAKLWAQAEAQAKEEKQKLKGGRTQAAWGTQIRSYVLHPYKMVKDLRTGVEITETDKVLDGEIDDFILSELKAGV